jgi:hypothetical protein
LKLSRSVRIDSREVSTVSLKYVKIYLHLQFALSHRGIHMCKQTDVVIFRTNGETLSENTTLIMWTRKENLLLKKRLQSACSTYLSSLELLFSSVPRHLRLWTRTYGLASNIVLFSCCQNFRFRQQPNR